MFDESEILFLDTAVALDYITRSQRVRLIGFAEEDDLGSVTEVVVDANLMTDEEVGKTVEAIQSGVSLGAPAPAALGDQEIAGAATSASISALIGEAAPGPSRDTDKVQAASSGSAFDALEAASQGSGEYEDEAEASGGPAFPLPTGANEFGDADVGEEASFEDPYGAEEEIPDEDQSVAQQLAVSGREVLSLLDDE